MENKIDVKKLREKVYEISNSKCPLDCFFNDIQQNNGTRYNKVLAYKDLETIADFIIELQNKDKTPTKEEIKKEWEALEYRVVTWDKNCINLEKVINGDKNNYNSHTIFIKIPTKTFFKSNSYYSVVLVTFQEHQLLTKTFKMLGWEV